MRSGIRKINSRVFERCKTSPPMVSLMSSACGSGTSSLVTIAGPRGGERIETLTQRPLTRSHLHVSRSYIVHDRVAEGMLLPSGSRNALTARPDDEREFGFVIGLLRLLRQDDGGTRPVEGGR